jgi:hypothetical protein
MSKAKTTSKVTTKSKPVATQRVLIVYGLDDKNKPRAAKFLGPDFELARKAAGLMKLQTHEADFEPLRRHITKVAGGDVYASGWGFVPAIGRSQYDALVKRLTGKAPPKQGELVPTAYPESWSKIAVGHCVIAQEDASEDGWWQAVVTAVDGDMLTLQWCVNPKQPKAKRHRSAVALLDPTAYAASN